MKKSIGILISLFVVIVVLTVVRAVVSNKLATTGIDLNKIAQELDTYKRGNALLEEKILHASSYLTISEEAQKRGYTEISGQIVFTSPLPLAYNQ